MALGTPRPLVDYVPAPREIAEGLFSVERRLRMPGGARLPTRTTLIRLRTGGLLVISAPPAEPGGLDEIDAIGPVEEIVAPSTFHNLYAASFAARHPAATLHLAPGLHERVAGLPVKSSLRSRPHRGRPTSTSRCSGPCAA